MDIMIAIPDDEWAAVHTLLRLITNDEQGGSGQVRLRSNGSRRQWMATDLQISAFVDITASGPECDLGISPGVVRYANTIIGDGTEAILRLYDTERGQRISLTGVGGTVDLADLGYSFPDIPGSMPPAENVVGSAMLNMVKFREAVVAAMEVREVNNDGENVEPPFWMSTYQGKFALRVNWPVTGSVDFVIDAESVTGEVFVPVNPRQLLTLIDLFQPYDDLTVGLPLYNNEPVVISAARATALLMPVKNEGRLARDRAESLINDVCGRLGAVLNEDGCYPLHRHTTPVFGRLRYDTDPALLQVFAVVLDGITASPDLYTELNDLNANSTFARLFHADEQVLAQVDLVAATLDEHELSAAIRRIRELAENIMPTLSAVLGGSLVEDPADVRLRAYRTTIIEAEIAPGSTVALNGTEATANWPFPGVVHVLTGWNPQGVTLSEQRHESVNFQIADDILRKGGRFVHGDGRSPAGDHSEPSLVAWGLTRSAAVEMGWRANQEAIFEIDANEVRLLSCIGDRVDVWPRMG